MITSKRCIFMEKCHLYYPFGNTQVRNVLKDLNIKSFDEKTGSSTTTQVLFLGSGDMRNTLQATTAEHVNSFHFHLNDNCPSIVARNIMILKILSAQDFDPNNEEDLSFLWDVWYNTEWPEITGKQFLIVLNDLLDEKLPENVLVPDPKHFKSLKKIWKVWYTISSRSQSESEMLLCEAKKKRSEVIVRSHTVDSPRNSDEKITHAQAFSRAINELTQNLMKKYAIGDLEDSVGRIIEQEFQAFNEGGSCRLQNELKTVCINPAFLNPDTELWQVYYSSCPFRGYLPLSQEELITSVKGKVILPTCHKILKDLVVSYKNRIANIKVFFYLEDALEFCFTNANKFDVIDCSNLADHIGLANLLNAASGKLSNNPGAVLFTESMDWYEFAPSVEMYVEHVLCCPLRMIPTIYGFKLNEHVELGSRYLPNWYVAIPANLSWQKAIPFQNIVMSPSSSLTDFLNKLAQKCFVSECFPNPSQVLSYQMAVLERHHYSPLTFHYIVSSMNQRLGGDHWFKDAHLLEIPALFNITRRTSEAWSKGLEILKMTAEIPINSSNRDALKVLNREPGAPTFRLVLVPCSMMFDKHFIHGITRKYTNIPFFGSSGSYVIDNFSLEMKENSEKIVATFLMASDHNLPEVYCVYVTENNHCPVLSFGSLKSMHTKKFLLPYPFSRPTPSSVLPSPEPSFLKVTSCIESENQFKLKIVFDCNEDVSGLTLSTDQSLPRKSAHQVTLSLNQPSKSNSLTLSFPYPILVNEIRAILHSTDRFIELGLKKGLWELWPVEFQSNEEWKWNVDSLKPWKKSCESFHFAIRLHRIEFPSSIAI